MAEIYPDLYENIPNTPVSLKNYAGRNKASEKTGDKIVFLGTASDGPVMELVDVNSGSSMFGPYFNQETGTLNGATLPLYIDRALRAGADNIAGMRISGSHANGQILFNSYTKTEDHKSKELIGEAPGNTQTLLSLPMETPNADFDYSFIRNVSLNANGRALEGESELSGDADFFIDIYSGELTLYREKTNAGAELKASYTEALATRAAAVDETLVNIVGTNDYDFANDRIQIISQDEADVDAMDEIEKLTVSDGATVLTEGVDYQVDYREGRLTLMNNYTPTNPLTATYTYEVIVSELDKEFNAEAGGDSVEFELDHLADSTEAFYLTANGVELVRGDSNDYNVTFISVDGEFKTVVELFPNNIEMGSNLYASYYWSDEYIQEPVIELESTMGGELYNDTVYRVVDVFSQMSKTTDVTAEESLEKVSSTAAKFKNRFVVPGSVGVITINRGGGATVTLDFATDVSINYNTGVLRLLNHTLNLSDSISVSAYSYYNVNNKKLIIQRPKEKVKDGPAELEFELGTDIETAGQLVTSINNHPYNNVVVAELDDKYTKVSAMEVRTADTKLDGSDRPIYTENNLTGGDDGLDVTKEEIYELLEGEYDSDGNKTKPGVYDLLFNTDDVKIVVPAGLYADDELLDEDKSFDKQLARFCTRAFYSNNEIKGIIGTKPLKNPSMLNIVDRVEDLLLRDNTFYLKDDDGNIIRDSETGEMIDSGKFISIVAGDLSYDDENLGVYTVENGAAAHAGLRSMIEIDNSTTNEKIVGAGLPYTYSRNQLNKLVGNKYIVFKNKNNAPYVVSGVNAAVNGTGWTRELTVDIVFDVLDGLREIFDTYIGKGNSFERRNSLHSDTEKFLARHQGLLDAGFEMVITNDDNFMKRVIFYLDLMPIEEYKKIQVILSINREV